MPRKARNDSVTERLEHLPAEPGCYIYKDESGSVLYVGKAISLRNRVRSYFQPSAKHGPRIARLVAKVRDIEWIVVTSEVEALVLECNLIKQYRPPYNVRLRDDKSYPYIVMTKEEFPRVMFTRRVRKDGGKYFGPYTSAFAVRDTLQLLHKVFPLIPCGKSWTGAAVQKPCLYYHLGRCLAPCAGLSDRAQYGETLSRVERFLQGKEESIVEDLRTEMDRAAEDLDFERAAGIRDQILAIEKVHERQRVLTDDKVDQDVIAVVKDERGAAIQMLYIRGGKLIGQRQYVLDGAAEALAAEAVQEFVKQYYADAPDVPREILLPVEIEERNIVQQWLRQRKGSAVTVEVPQTGEKARLMDMAAANAEQALNQFATELAQKSAWVEDAMAQLQEALQLPTLPSRVEGYDISNIQGTAPVGSMVVTENGEPAKAEYRRFKVKWSPEAPNDFAMMHEVIYRRLKNLKEGDEKFAKIPDLILVDGGKGQLSAALKARHDLGISVPMVGLAKRHELLYLPNPDPTAEERFIEVELPLNSPGLLLLRRLRDEAHRFALSFHRKLRDKRMGASALEDVPGVGPRRRRLLLRNFGSIDAIRRATVEQIAAVPTMTKELAARVREYLQET
ncbi:MAG: excinuclease ABC subunit UvrC [Fimbriimonadaceae bacterium]|nr:excinuclease ABC subunit UvrC [Fimbriimonadaceae bacterium]